MADERSPNYIFSYSYYNLALITLCAFSVLFFATQSRAAEHLVSVTRFGAIADAVKANNVWVGTDNSKAINDCADYCRLKGLTMFFPKGNYGVASTIWLTNPDRDGLKQASIAVLGSNRGAFWDQSTSVKICVLKNFTPGRIVNVKKKAGQVVKEPDIVPVFAVNNGRQVHLEGLCIQGENKKDLICGIAIGNISMMTSLKNCSIDNLYAGIVLPGIRRSPNESVIEGNNDLLVVEQCTFNNAYNIICAGTQPFACEYRNSCFLCTRSVFTGTLMTNHLGHTRGSHKFSSNLFQTAFDARGQDTVYFNLQYSEITIDSCHFETTFKRDIPEVLVRQIPGGGNRFREQRFAFTNNVVNFTYVNKNPTKFRPIVDTLVGNRMIFQGNSFHVGTAVRIKALGAIFIGNSFRLDGPCNLAVAEDEHLLTGTPGKIEAGLYEFNHFIRKDSEVKMSLSDGTSLKEGVHYKVKKDSNAFEITSKGKELIDEAKATQVLASYRANDGSKVMFEAWGANKFNPSQGGWRSGALTLIANKVIGRRDDCQLYEGELQTKAIHKLAIKDNY